MKKNLIVKVLAVLSIALVAASCQKKKPETQEKPEYTISFNTLGGSSVSEIKGHEGDAVASPEAPTKSYFKFEGWYTDQTYTTVYNFSTISASNVTVYAKWSPLVASTITFDSLGGSKVNSIYGTEGDSITLPTNPTRTGYTFAGWYTDANLTKAFTATTYTKESVTLYAKWTPVEGMYSVTYHVGDTETELFSESGKLEFNNTLIPEGVTVEGWYLDEACSQKATANQTLTKSIDLYANVYTSGLVFDGSKVTGYTGSNEDVYIPSLFNGTQITEIGEACFYNNKNITSLYMPQSIKTIGAYAFYNATYLDNIEVSENLSNLGSYAFFNCKRLKTISTLGKITKVNDSTFAGCEILTNLVVPTTVTEVGAYAFADCKKVSTLNFNEGLTSVGAYAFNNCISLESLALPSSLTSLGADALTGCNLNDKNFTLGKNNTTYAFADGLLMNAEKTVLIKCLSNAKSITIPSTVTQIKANAFNGNSSITKLDISNISNVEKGALAKMTGLTELTILNLEKPVAYYFGANSAKDNGAANAYVSDSLTTINVVNKVDEIEAYAFYGINNLNKITGIDGADVINEYAFAYTAFSSYKLNKDVTSFSYTAFYRCPNFTKYEVAAENTTYTAINDCIYNKAGNELLAVPACISSFSFAATCDTIAYGAFNGVSLTELVISDKITNLVKGCLFGIVNLHDLTVNVIGDGNKNSYMHYLFNMTLVETVEEEDGEEKTYYEFDTLAYLPTSLKKLTITSNITEVSKFAFAYFEDLTEINYPNSVTKIGDYAYAKTSISELNLPATVTEVGEFAFAYCYDLKKIEVNAVTLGRGIFANDLRVEEVTFGEGLKAIPDYCFYPYRESNGDGTYKFYSQLVKINIPSTVESIGQIAFMYAGNYGINSSMTDDDNDYTKYNLVVNFAKNSKLKTIGDGAFEHASIFKIELPASVEVLEQEAFAFCSNLESISFGNATEGSNLKTIGEISFAYTESLKEMKIYKNVASNEDVPELLMRTTSSGSYYPFYSTNEKLKIYVPEASVTFYKENQSFISANVANLVYSL